VRPHEQIEHKLAPRENQKIAIDEAVVGLTDHGFHGMLMEMSLGKTKCALNVAEILEPKSIVVVCPKAIQSVWLDELPKQSHIDVEPVVWQNNHTKKFKRSMREMSERHVGVYLINLELFQRKNAVLYDWLQMLYQEPTLVILDESSKIKNVTTNRAPRLIEYTRGSAYRVILTGTPWSESPLDIFSQMEFLQEGFWYKHEGPWKLSILRKHWYIFRNRYAIMQQITLAEGRSFKTIVGTRRTEEIARKIAPYITQQKKVDWVDLPEKIFQTLHVVMGPEQYEAYKSMEERLILEHGDEVITASNAGTLLIRLRQIAGGFVPESGEPLCPNLAGIGMLLEDVAEYAGKVVIAASFIAEIEGIVNALSKEYGVDNVCTYYGATKNRDEELKRFEESAKFMVLNPQTGAYGLNLQFASLMYFYSRPFSYEQNAQLIDRIHRPGQKETCVYKDIIHKGTVQEKPIAAFKRKKKVVEDFDGIVKEGEIPLPDIGKKVLEIDPTDRMTLRDFLSEKT
jgi:SNF2 family DNA or RNA helicase